MEYQKIHEKMNIKEEQTIGYLDLFGKNRNFRMLWFGQFVSLIGDHFNTVASVLLAISVTGGSGLPVGLVLALRFLPKILFSTLGGMLADRYDRRRLLIFLDIVMAAAAACYVFVRHSTDLWLLYVLAALMGGLSAAFGTTRLSFVPDIIKKQQLTTALGLNQISIAITVIIGSALGGSLVGGLGYKMAFIINAFTFLISAVFTWAIKSRYISHGDDITAEPCLVTKSQIKFYRKFTDEFADGLRYLKKQPFLMSMISLDLLWSMGGGATYVVIAILNYQRFGNNEQTLGIIYAMGGVGALLATTLRPWIGRQIKSDILLLGLSCLLEGIIFIFLVMNFNLVALAIIFMVRTSVSGAFGLIYYPIFLKFIADDMRGRVVGLNNSLILPILGLSTAIYGLLLNYMDVITVGFIAGGIMMFAGIIWLTAVAVRFLPGFQEILDIEKKIS